MQNKFKQMRKLYIYTSLVCLLWVGTYLGTYIYNRTIKNKLICQAVIAERVGLSNIGKDLTLHGWIQINTISETIKLSLLYGNGKPRWKGIISYKQKHDLFGDISSAKITSVTPDIITAHSKSNDITTSFFIGKEYPMKISHVINNLYLFEFGNNYVFCKSEY